MLLPGGGTSTKFGFKKINHEHFFLGVNRVSPETTCGQSGNDAAVTKVGLCSHGIYSKKVVLVCLGIYMCICKHVCK